MFKKYINSNKKDITDSICKLINFPSISIETGNPQMPFGEACSNALNYFLNLAKDLGFKTKNVDGYCGYVEFGEDPELMGIIGHLDVVPAIEKDWSFSPYSATIVDNKIYGRGAIDDKGPIISSLYAMKAVMDYCFNNNIKLNKRIRLIVGLNEEKDWKCINYYKSHEEIPTFGFSPDSDFPCIYAEKSVLSLLLASPYIGSNKISILDFDTNDNAINVVPKYCSVSLKIDESIDLNIIKNTIAKYDYDINLKIIDKTTIKLISYGIAAHSAHPDLGINAISHLIIVLNDIFEFYNIDFSLFKNYCKYIGNEYCGNSMGLNIKDESGNLTLNTSQLYIENNKICIGINLRIPVKTSIDYIIDKFKANFIENEVIILNKMDSLYVDKNSKIVKTLCDIFNTELNTNLEPIAIGGATYARAFPNCVSFGMNFPGDTDMCHQADEFVDISKLLLATNIYAKAIFKLVLQ